MLDSIKDMLARFVFEDEFLNGHITTEIYQEILAWIYASHEKNMNMALGALEALEIADGTGHYIYTIISIKKMIALLHETVLTQLIFVEDDNATDESRIIFIVQSDKELKKYIKYYAYKRGLPLRSLRFSHAGKRLLLSSVGHLPPKDLGMRDNDVIVVHDKHMPREASSSVNNKENMADTSSKASLMKTKKNTKAKKKSKVKKNLNQNEEHAVADEYYKAQHFKILSTLHQEMQPRLKEIRMKLNTLSLERQSPKSRKKKSKRSMKEEANHNVADTVGGKAGKPNFVLQVGEEQYLYKTHKSSARTSQNSQRNIPTLDLHGCTREEAVVKLNKSLKVWVETAMKGSYPFVITAEIVCGCGSQVLSETVQTWIKSTSHVRNARKNT